MSVAKAVVWTSPRCRSTVFERSIRTLEGVKVFHEYYCTAAYQGEDRTLQRYSKNEPIPNSKFEDVQKTLEGSFTNCKGVFVKDVAYAMVGKLDTLPEGYHHTFIIRDPTNAITSLYRVITEGDLPDWADGFLPIEAGFREMWDLYQHLKEVKGLQPLVLDADDVLSDPASMMKKYCDVVGFEYTDDMLHWKPESESEKWTWEADHFTWEKDWYGTILSSSGFIKPTEGAANKSVDVSFFPQYVQKAIEEARPYYDKLYELRMKP
ncbi:uncharacterized protein LOC144438252 [Glandiceps talaboti]